MFLVFVSEILSDIDLCPARVPSRKSWYNHLSERSHRGATSTYKYTRYITMTALLNNLNN